MPSSAVRLETNVKALSTVPGTGGPVIVSSYVAGPRRFLQGHDY